MLSVIFLARPEGNVRFPVGPINVVSAQKAFRSRKRAQHCAELQSLQQIGRCSVLLILSKHIIL